MGTTVPKRRFQTTSRHVITQKTKEFSPTAAEAYDLVNTSLRKSWDSKNSFLSALTTHDETQKKMCGSMATHILILGFVYKGTLSASRSGRLTSAIRYSGRHYRGGWIASTWGLKVLARRKILLPCKMTPNHPAGKQVSYTLTQSLTFSTAVWHHKSMMLHCKTTSKYFTLLCFFTTVDEGTCTTHWHKNFNKESFVSKSHRTLLPNLQRKTDFCNVTTKACSCMLVPNTLQFHSNSILITIRFEVINSGCCSNGMASYNVQRNKFLVAFRNNLPICSGWQSGSGGCWASSWTWLSYTV